MSLFANENDTLWIICSVRHKCFLMIILTFPRAKAKFKLFQQTWAFSSNSMSLTAITALDRPSPHVLHNKLSVVLILDLKTKKTKKLKSQICTWGLQWHLDVCCSLGIFWMSHLHTGIQSFLGAPNGGLVNYSFRTVDWTCLSTYQSTRLKQMP